MLEKNFNSSVNEDLIICQDTFGFLDDKGGFNDTLLAWGRPEANSVLIFWIPFPWKWCSSYN